VATAGTHPDNTHVCPFDWLCDLWAKECEEFSLRRLLDPDHSQNNLFSTIGPSSDLSQAIFMFAHASFEFMLVYF